MIHALLDPSDLPHRLPRFADIEIDDYGPAIEQGMAEQLAALQAITSSPDEPTFENTLVALERSGERLDRVLRVFFSLLSADSSDALDELNAAYAPRLAAHHDALLLDDVLFARVNAVYEKREELEGEDRYLVERYHRDFVLAGAALGPQEKARLRELNQEISGLEAAFGQAAQADSNDLAVVVDTVEELAGLTPGEISAAAAAAENRGLPGKFLITLTLFTSHPYLSVLENRGLRQRLFEAQISRGSRGNADDTRGIALDALRLRAEKAQLLGFDSYAGLVTADNTAGTPKAVRDMLERLAAPAARNARAEQAALEASARAADGLETIEAWDWPFYAEKVRASEYDVDLAVLRPWFEADRVLRDGVFYAAERLYGLTFEERPDLQGYHPEVRVFEVSRDGEPIGLYLLDLYTRDSKKGGAWMNSYATANTLLGEPSAIVTNNLNVPKPAPGEPTLLTFDEVNTLFHEFGHALHGLLARATYPRFAATAVYRDFVEYPSQVNEMWMLWPEVLANYAVHHETGEPIPADVLGKLEASATFNEGFATSEYLAAALIDLAWHELSPAEVPTSPEAVAEFEAATLSAVGLDNRAVRARYYTAYFKHIFGGYASAYYSYIWSEVLDADTVAWFTENGGLTRENGEAYVRHVIGIGGTRDPLESYAEWRGRPAPIAPLLERRGLA